MKGTDNLETVRAFFDEVINSGDVDSIPSFVSRDALVPQSIPGPEGVRRLLGELRGAFSDPEFKAMDTISDGEKVAVRLSGKATHTGKYLGLPPSDRVLKIWGVMIFKFESGMISEFWSLVDAQGILAQLRSPPL